MTTKTIRTKAIAKNTKAAKQDRRASAKNMAGTDATETKILATPVSGAELFVPLDKLKKSPRNARKTPHPEAHIEALAASIAAKGMLQNLVVEPARDAEGVETGFYLVTIGEGRRQAQRLRAKRGEIDGNEPIRCVLDTENDAHEISLDENVTREAMHPADQFEAFRTLAEERGFGAEDIAARFGVTANAVRQRLRLGAVSPRLMQVYRDGGLTLDQLMAFAITEDHARQEQVFDNLSWNKDPSVIRRDLTRTHITATDRRAIFVGPEAYTEADGVILRDLFTEDRGGFYEDPALLDRLALAKLEGIATAIQKAEGWKWSSASIDFPHAHGMRRAYPKPATLSEADIAAHDRAQAEYNALSEEYEGVEEPPEAVDARFGELEAEIERVDALRYAYDPDEITRGGVFVMLYHDGTARIERGFIRPEDEKPEPETVAEADGVDGDENGEAEAREGKQEGGMSETSEDEAEDADKPLSDALVRDLTAHRTLGLRLALGEQPEIALLAITHALAAQTFYRGAEASCLEIRPVSAFLGSHAEGIEDTVSGKVLADRHAGWAGDMPRDVGDLWGFISGLDHASVMALLAHCAALTVNAVKQPWERKPHTQIAADRLASALAFDMAAHWFATTRSYLARVTKARILSAVREGVGNEAAQRIADMKKAEMAEAAETLLVGTSWLPPLLRTPEVTSNVEQERPTTKEDADQSADDSVDRLDGGKDAIAIAAE